MGHAACEEDVVGVRLRAFNLRADGYVPIWGTLLPRYIYATTLVLYISVGCVLTRPRDETPHRVQQAFVI